MRQLVGATDVAAFENATSEPLFGLPRERFDSVLDFGCGCGRLARNMMQQDPPPRVYVGVDLHKGMVKWCQDNLSAVAPNFIFLHHDVFNLGFNPGADKPLRRPLAIGDKQFSLIIAHSVFTHTIQSDAEYYLREMARLLRDDGELVATFFMFDKRYFPMMQDFQNTLYINVDDPWNATIFDRDWLQLTMRSLGLTIVSAKPPAMRGFQWQLRIRLASCGEPQVVLPEDQAPFGRQAPPVVGSDPSLIGLQT